MSTAEVSSAKEVTDLLAMQPFFDPSSEGEDVVQSIPLTAQERLTHLSDRLNELEAEKVKYAVKLPKMVDLCKEAIAFADQVASEPKKGILQEEIAATKKSFGIIYGVATKVADTVEKFLGTLDAPASSSEASSVEPAELKQARGAISTLKQFLETHAPQASAGVEKLQKEPKANIPHVHPDSVALLKNYGSLLADLSELMSGALDPEVQTQASVLKDKLAVLNAQFVDLTVKSDAVFDRYESLVRSVGGKLHSIEQLVEEFEGKPINEASIKDIAIFTKKTEAEVLEDINVGKALNTERKERHDELAKVWCDVLIAKATIEWELKRIEIYAGIHSEAEKLNDKLSKLEGKIEKTKDKLKAEVPRLKGQPQEIEKLLAATKPVLETYYKDYNEYAKSAQAKREKAEQTLAELHKQKEDAGKVLLDALKGVHLYDEAKREEIATSAKAALGQIQDEREVIFTNFDFVWKSVFKKVDFADTKTSVTYELVRLCYAVEKNGGNLPTDSGYKSMIPLITWTPVREPVKSPWTPEVPAKVVVAAAQASSSSDVAPKAESSAVVQEESKEAATSVEELS